MSNYVNPVGLQSDAQQRSGKPLPAPHSALRRCQIGAGRTQRLTGRVRRDGPWTHANRARSGPHPAFAHQLPGASSRIHGPTAVLRRRAGDYAFAKAPHMASQPHSLVAERSSVPILAQLLYPSGCTPNSADTAGAAWISASTYGGKRVLATSVPAIPEGRGPGGVQGRQKRQYLVDRKGTWSHLSRNNLAKSALKASIMAGQPVFMKLAQEEFEGGGLDVEPNWGELFQGFPEKAIWAFVRVLGVNTLVKGMDFLAVTYLSLRVADRFTKDIWKSVLRKVHKYGRVRASQLIVRTCVYSNAFIYASNFLYDEALMILRMLRNHRKRWRAHHHMNAGQANAQAEEELAFWRLTARNLKLYTVAEISGAIGYGLGTLVWPGWGSTIGGLALEAGIGYWLDP